MLSLLAVLSVVPLRPLSARVGLAVKLNSFEQHRTATQYEDRLIAKQVRAERSDSPATVVLPTCVRIVLRFPVAAFYRSPLSSFVPSHSLVLVAQFFFQFINSYFSLFYIAYFKGGRVFTNTPQLFGKDDRCKNVQVRCATLHSSTPPRSRCLR